MRVSSIQPLFLFLAVLVTTTVVNSLVHHLRIAKDDRNMFPIETFGFVVGGVIELNIADFDISKSLKKHEASTNSSVATIYKTGLVRREAGWPMTCPIALLFPHHSSPQE
jgi:hypothetical protein